MNFLNKLIKVGVFYAHTNNFERFENLITSFVNRISLMDYRFWIIF